MPCNLYDLIRHINLPAVGPRKGEGERRAWSEIRFLTSASTRWPLMQYHMRAVII